MPVKEDPIVNVRRGEAGQLRTHCKRGHAMTEDNVYHRKGERGRFCKTCHKSNMRTRKERIKNEKTKCA